MLKEMGVGEELSRLLVSCYGGHVYMICEHLVKLEQQYKTAGHIQLIKEGAANVDIAVASWLAAGGDYGALRDALCEVARTGFCPRAIEGYTMKPHSITDMAQILTTTNVCGYLSDSAVEYHVPPTLRQGRCGLVPSSPLMRLMIAYKLHEWDVKRQSSDKRK
jgi:hypothetical protein